MAGLDIVAAHILLSNTDVELTTAKDHREARLKRALDNVKDDYDYVFVPPVFCEALKATRKKKDENCAKG